MRRTVFLLSACLWLAVSPAGASDIQVQYGDDGCGGTEPKRLIFTARSGETNRLTLGSARSDDVYGTVASLIDIGPGCLYSGGGFKRLYVSDGGADIHRADVCSRLRPRAVECPLAYVEARLGDGNDAVLASVGAHSMTVDAGPGDDAVRVVNDVPDEVSCGDGTDTVVADAGDIVAADCESVSRL